MKSYTSWTIFAMQTLVVVETCLLTATARLFFGQDRAKKTWEAGLDRMFELER